MQIYKNKIAYGNNIYYFCGILSGKAMATFGWFGDQQHRVFNYRPRYYDEQKESRRQMFGGVDGSLEEKAEKGEYVPGASIRGAFRDGAYARKRSGGKAHTVIGIIGLALVAVILIFITKFYSLL